MGRGAQRALAVVLVVLAGALAYSPALDNGFLNLDDLEFIRENPWIPGGLTFDSVTWALTADVFEDTEYADYWQPATLISRLIDGALFGLDPAGHHFTNILIHLLNAVLVLLLLVAATGRLWQSAVVSLIFVTHPLHVSSVAWVAERKDVLSAFFSLVSLAVFARFAASYRAHLEGGTVERAGSRVVGWYVLLVAGYALSLMSKPMTLTLPVMMLLVAVWPMPRTSRPGLGRLALCLAPLLLLSAFAIFLYTHVDVVRNEFERTGAQSPFSFVARMVMSLAAYPLRLLCPVRLQHIYSIHPGEVIMWKVAGSLLLLGAVTTVVAVYARRHSFLAVGWLWYLVAILPAATSFQDRAAADHFSYLPVLGLTMMIVWGVGEMAGRRHLVVLTAATAAAVIALALTTRAECRHWKDSITFFSHLLELDPNHDLAHRNLGSALLEAGEHARALESYRAALAARPDLPTHSFNVGVALERLGRLGEASHYFAETVRLDPSEWYGYNGLGMTLWGMGRIDEAEANFRKAIRLNPGFALARYNLGLLLGKAEKYDEALTQFREAARLNPGDAETRSRIDAILERQRRNPGRPAVR